MFQTLKRFFRGQSEQEKPWNSAERANMPNFRLRILSAQCPRAANVAIPYPQPFFTPYPLAKMWAAGGGGKPCKVLCNTF